MDHTAKSYNTLRLYNTYPVSFQFEDKLIVFSRLFNLWDRALRTRCDFIELSSIETPSNFDIIQQDKATSMYVFHN